MAILDKYEKNIKDLISRYETHEEDSMDIVDVFDYAEEETLYLDSISFIKNNTEKTLTEGSKILIFQDIYKMLCTECDFEEIFRIFK